jgi:ATP phosphoribosyltransferase regulatory subunit
VITRGALGGARPAYRVFDENGEVLVLRSDMTVPIARLVASRYQAAEPPLRFAYFAHCYRGVRPQRGQPREFLQAGIELVGAAGARRHRRSRDRALPRARQRRASALPRRHRRRALYPALMDSLGVAGRAADAAARRAGYGDFVGLENALAELPIDEARASCC